MSNVPYLTGPFDPSLEQMNQLIQEINAAIASTGSDPNPTFTTLTVTGASSLDNGAIVTDGSGSLHMNNLTLNVLSTDNNSNQWKFGGHSTGVLTAAGSLAVTVNGTTYQVLTSA